MEQTCTLNDLIRFLYRETSDTETISIASTLAENYLLNEEFVELALAKHSMAKVGFLPSKKVLNAVINYSNSEMMEVSC